MEKPIRWTHTGLSQSWRDFYPSVLVRAVGTAGVALIEAEFPGKASGGGEPPARRRCAPMVRGLAARLSIRKVQAERVGQRRLHRHAPPVPCGWKASLPAPRYRRSVSVQATLT